MGDGVVMESNPRSETGWRPHGPLGPDETLYFLHIPKTAGSSMRLFLEDHFHADEVIRSSTAKELIPLSPTELERYRLILGHHGRIVLSLLKRRPTIITMMRDPVKRSISHFEHLRVKGIEDNSLCAWVRSVSFDEFIAHPIGQSELANYQARHLALARVRDEYQLHARKRDSAFEALMRGYTDPSLFDRAMETLESAAFIGTQERFQESLGLLARTFAWPAPGEYPRFNATTQAAVDRGAIGEAVVARVRELTAIDQRLYERAAELLDGRLRLLPGDDAETSAREHLRSLPRIDRLSLGFERPLLGRGWLPREQGPSGRVCRWTGPERSSTIDLPLATDRTLILQFLAAAQTNDVIESVRVFVNDVEAPLEWWYAEPALDKPKRVFRATLTPDALRRGDGFSRIRFEVKRAIVPAEVWPGHQDRRSLALYFHWLDIFPAWT